MLGKSNLGSASFFHALLLALLLLLGEGRRGEREHPGRGYVWGRRLEVEHMYADTDLEAADKVAKLQITNQNGEEVEVLNVQPSLVAKGACKGKGCPSLHKRKVRLEGCGWGSVNNKDVVVEESSGWYYFWYRERPSEGDEGSSRRRTALPPLSPLGTTEDPGNEGRQVDEHVGEGVAPTSSSAAPIVTSPYPPFFNPLLPTREDLQGVKSNGELGYLKRGKAGYIVFTE